MSDCPSQNCVDETTQDRAFGALVGLAVGDALGTTLEFSKRDTQSPVVDIVGGGPFRLRPGEWTDDTSMALCLADSLVANNGLSERDLLGRFLRWWELGENSVNGRCFDIGNTTRQALAFFKRHGRWVGQGPDDKYQAGNGSLMRLAPAAIFATGVLEMAKELAERQSLTTHGSSLAAEACALFAQMLVEAIDGQTKDEVLRQRAVNHRDLADVAAGEWREKARHEISSSGYVVDTLEAALWSVGRTDNFADALILAVNLGGDADTVGAVTGQIAGAIYGRSGIPSHWLKALAWRDRIEQRAIDLLRSGLGARSNVTA
ncbi:ADP-ribosylglycohydrolase family protein [Rhodoblastus sp. 17X3]|uniref:ADP-ribosylglycohydrolase family protein n=1 Tax=Rhodoblastus sp. 17X3 TaxID=3047026 RepID=UPI0024B65841|nr:ADP-ribosylglycohydrolase family protein [Rhodoblastus sp. 17X3]MDI9849520.1 ADP-ribosylglycohydrolase family protein [Rhodoblastus sp. 17X3]